MIINRIIVVAAAAVVAAPQAFPLRLGRANPGTQPGGGPWQRGAASFEDGAVHMTIAWDRWNVGQSMDIHGLPWWIFPSF